MALENNNTGTSFNEAPTQDGVFPIRGMKGLNSLQDPSVDLYRRLKDTPILQTNPDIYDRPTAITGSMLPEDYGSSKYDEDLNLLDVVEQEKTLNQLKAEQQSAGAKLLNGIIGAGALAASTFVRGTVGLGAGLVALIDQDPNTTFVNNPVNNLMNDWDDFVNENVPIYQTKFEEEHPWKNIFSAGSFSNNLIKNAGFIVGAAMSGGVYSNIVKNLGIASKIGSGIARVNNTVRAAKAADTGYEVAKATIGKAATGAAANALVSTMSAIGEGTFEASTNSKEWEEEQIAKRGEQFQTWLQNPSVQSELLKTAQSMVSIDNYSVVSPEGEIIRDMESYNQAVQETYNNLIEERWSDIRTEIHDDALKMANADLLANIPILALSNWILLGRLFRGGYKASRVAKIRGSFKEGFSTLPKALNTIKTAGKAAFVPVSEGLEEMNQSAAAAASGIWAEKDLDQFMEDKYDIEAENDTSNFLDAVWKGLQETYANKDNWLEFTYGAILGASPIPMPRLVRSENGSPKFQTHWEVWNTIKDSREEQSEAQRLVDYLNKRAADPKFKTTWESRIANNSLQAKMNESADDPFNFKNYEHRQAIHDLVALERAGKLGTFQKQLRDMASAPNTPELIESIRSSTTDPNGESWTNGLIDEEVYNRYKKNAEDLIKTTDYFANVSENIRVNYGDVFSDDALSEMVYIRTQIQDWKNRAIDIKNTLDSEVLEELSRSTTESEKVKEVINWLNTSDPNYLPDISTKDVKTLTSVFSDLVGKSNIVDKTSAISNLSDLFKIVASIDNGISTYNKYLQNPDRLNKKAETKKQEAQKKATKKEATKAQSRVEQTISDARTLSDLQTAMSSQDMEFLEEQGIENATLIEDTKQKVAKTERVRELAMEGVDPEDPASKAAQSLIDFVTEHNLADEALDPNSVEAVYGPEIAQAIENGIIDVPENAKPDFSKEVIDIVEDTLRRAQEEQDKLATLPDVVTDQTPEQTEISEDTEEELPNITSGMVDQPQEELTSTEEASIIGSKREKVTKSSLYTAVPEAHKEALTFVDGKNSLIKPDDPNWKVFEEVYIKRNPAHQVTDFSDIYRKLEQYGAFDYIRNHVIPTGTEVFLVADPKYLGPDAEKYGIPIFYAVRTSDGKLQPIGVTPSYKSDQVNSTLTAVGQELEALAKLSKDEWLISTKKLTVASVIDGSFIRSNDNIETVNQTYIGDTKTSLGVVVGDMIYTKGGAVYSSKISSSVSNWSNYNGRPVLLVQATSGKYKVIPLRTKTLGEDISIDSDLPIIKTLKSNISTLVSDANSGKSNTVLDKDIIDIKDLLYLPNLYLYTSKDKLGNTRLNIIQNTPEGKKLIESIILKEAVPVGETATVSQKDIQDQVLSFLADLSPKFQVSVGAIERGFGNSYLESDILYTDIDSPKIYNTWFTFSEVSEKAPKEVVSTTLENEVVIGKKSYHLSPEGWRDSRGSLVVDGRILKAIERKTKVSGNQDTMETPKVRVANPFQTGRVVTKSKPTATQNKTQNNLENSDKSLIFASLPQQVKEALERSKVSEQEFNSMPREIQDNIIKCL